MEGVLKHVRQKHPNGCAIACLSMLTGVPYDDVARDFSGDRTKEGVSCFTYDIWLNYRGYALIRKYKHYSPLHADRAEWPCKPFADAHLCSVRLANNTHAIVMLADGAVLDPERDELRKLSDYPEVNYIAGIYRVSDPHSPVPLIGLHWSDGNKKCQWCGAANDSYQYHDPCPARSGLTTPK